MFHTNFDCVFIFLRVEKRVDRAFRLKKTSDNPNTTGGIRRCCAAQLLHDIITFFRIVWVCPCASGLWLRTRMCVNVSVGAGVCGGVNVRVCIYVPMCACACVHVIIPFFFSLLSCLSIVLSKMFGSSLLIPKNDFGPEFFGTG